ncbi:HEAT repeat protein-like protein [Setomelanomma holmii]|uniref:HEAT repeat protein-like protein n=1 Tax=Setomelanomma holmii TaxID=210430 RepID=A0A9P4GZ72_9PLEO|nr:HEAT repeat protein-like protein [Setomelanomma holmii]
MADATVESCLPVPDKTLRDLARNASKALPDFAKKEPAIGVKELHVLLDPVLATADIPNLSPAHRAAASNALCAIIEFCQASDSEHAWDALLDDSVWLRTLYIYLQRSDNAKGKSMRQMLLVLTSVITKHGSNRAYELRKLASRTFLDIICDRQDRTKVKPALQGLAHFLLRDVVTIAQLVEIHGEVLTRSSGVYERSSSLQILFQAFLTWIVHHDTSLSAGHLVKNYLLQARKLPDETTTQSGAISPFWIQPVVWSLHDWPDRMQEFKTHVFPHCFLPDIEEYMRFLSYLHFSKHMRLEGPLPEALKALEAHDNSLSEHEEFRIFLTAIEAGKELTIIRDNDYRTCKDVQLHDGAIYLPDDVFGQWMSHPEPEVRLAGMFLSVYSTSITRQMTAGIFQALRKNLVHLHTDSDANFRREVHGYTQKLFDRLRASTATLTKVTIKSRALVSSRLPIPKACFSNRRSSFEHSDNGALYEALAFIVWYIRFLEWELRCTASYQRRITALHSLTIVLRSGIDPGVPHSHLSKSAQGQLNWAHGLQIANPRLTRVLLDLILDPFDDIRSSAVSALQLCLTAQPLAGQNAVLSEMRSYLDRAATTELRTGRADQADGVARAWALLFSLLDHHPAPHNPTTFSSSMEVYRHLTEACRSTIAYAHQNLSMAVNERPVHGYFAALRLIVDQHCFYDAIVAAPSETFLQWKQAHDKNLDYVEDFWNCIHHILCADAPEGHVPDEIDEEASLDTKEVLSYSWRGLKESSALLRVMITKAPVGDDERSLISPASFERLGSLCFTQLLELRHRGAFSTVSQTFAAICCRCTSSNIPAIRALPETWYKETLLSIQDKAGAITRRSAGIPALMASILAADTGDLFSRAMTDLVAEASVEAQSANIEESRLPQVHALNCIKEFFTTSRLNVASETYMGQGLELAARTLNSETWPIRNCSLMLFKALIERLLGSDEAQDWKERDRAKTSRFSYDNYTNLVGMISELLNPEGPLKQSIEDTPDSGSPFDLHGAEGVFPALQILRQARPPEPSLDGIVASVERLLSSPHWHLRDMAARTVVSLRSTRQLRAAISTLLKAEQSFVNLQHGTLLTVKHLLRKLLRNSNYLGPEDLSSLMEEVGRYVSSYCPFVRAAVFDIVSLFGMTMLHRPKATSTLDAWLNLTSVAELGPDYALGVRKRAGGSLLRQALARAFFINRIIVRNDTSLEPKDCQGIGEALRLLAKKDGDTCCTALDTIDEILQLRPPNCLAITLDLIIADVHSLVLCATDPEVISKVQAVLAKALTNHDYKPAFFNHIPKQQVMVTLEKLETQCLLGRPSNMQSALHLLGFFLDFAYTSYPSHRHAVLGAIARYIRLIRMTIIDTNPFDMRFAAVQSLAALQHIWTASTTSKSTGPLILGLSFILYDLLNDDDDEIRDIAALATASLLRDQITHDSNRTFIKRPEVKHTVPLLTSHHLAHFLSRTFSTSPYLPTAALRRLLNTPTPTRLFPIPFESVLKYERKEDTALFATEKQNLYKDNTLDAVLWTRILTALPPASIPSNLRVGLVAYIRHALAVLAHVAELERDGALGWTSKPEVFTLVVRVVCAAEVCLKWAAGQERSEVLVGLGRFAEAGERGEVHGLLMERVGSVLEREIIGVFGRVAGTLRMV